MNYPTYNKIYQICFLPMDQMKQPEDMVNWVNGKFPDVIDTKVLNKPCDWCTAMNAIISECKNDSIVPILHLDMHGSKDGYGLDFIELIHWSFLIDKITELNQVCNGQLFLSLNICEGLLIYQNLSHNNYPLSLKTIGSYKDVNAAYGKKCFVDLYLEYFINKDMNGSISKFFDVDDQKLFALI